MSNADNPPPLPGEPPRLPGEPPPLPHDRVGNRDASEGADPSRTFDDVNGPFVDRAGGASEAPTIASGEGKVFGRYRIVRRLGRGGMGLVYLAEDSVLKRRVALKIPQFAPGNAANSRARFMREARTAAGLSHPNICQVYDVEIIDNVLVMSMEYIDGNTLAAQMRSGKVASPRYAAQLVRKIALAVEVAHRSGVIHRDLKPANIMLARVDPKRRTIEPKVMDFGLARATENEELDLTQDSVIGTACYMPKEQWAGRRGVLGPPTDVYALGVILYQLLTGQLPYEVASDEPPTAWLMKLMSEKPRAPRQWIPGIDPDLEAITMRAIAKDADGRFASMADFAAALETWSKGRAAATSTALQPTAAAKERRSALLSLIAVLIGAVTGVLFVRACILDNEEVAAWQIFWRSLANGGSWSPGQVLTSATFAKSSIGALGGCLLAWITRLLLFRMQVRAVGG